MSVSSSFDEILQRFEAEWQGGSTPELTSYCGFDALAAEPPSAWHFRLLIELILLDLEYRIAAGLSVTVEDYLEQYPYLKKSPASILMLITTEYHTHHRLRGPTVEDYVKRFPFLRADIVDRLQPLNEEALNDEALNDEDDLSVQTLAPSHAAAAHRALGAVRQGDAEQVSGEVLLGHFQLQSVIGQGAFGTVYRAWDTRLNRLVAIKVPHAGSQDSLAMRSPAEREARIAAALVHPNIVTLYETIVSDQGVCLVSEYVQGLSLEQWLQSAQPDMKCSITWVVAIAKAVQHAHDNAVVHRDIKPSNILVDQHGTAYLTDFGLARQVSSISSLSAHGQLLGTIAYMSPEQAAGNQQAIDHRTDIYSLGVVLYRLLTGNLPHCGSTQQLLNSLLNGEPKSLRHHRPELPRSLECICLKAMHRQPAQRYGTALEFAEDLERFLKGEAVRARPESGLRRCIRRIVRHPVQALLMSALIVSIVLGLSISTWQWSVATKEKQRASANFVKAYNTLSTLTQLSRHYGIKDPAQEKTLADLTTAIRPYYQEVLDEAQRNADSVDALDLARAHSGIAQLHLLSSEHVSAAQHFQKALNILAGEGRGDPLSSSDARRLSAASLVSLATAYRRDNQRDAALAVYHQAEGLLNQLVDSGELPFRGVLAEVHWYIGELTRPEDPAASLEHARRARDIWQALVSAEFAPEVEITTELAMELAKCDYLIGSALYDLNALAEAAPAFQAAIRRYEPIARAHPSLPNVLRDLGASYHNLGRVLSEQQQITEAVAAFRQARQAREQVVALVPDEPRYRSDLQGTLRYLDELQQ